MRATVDIPDHLRPALLALAARKGYRGYSRVIADALDHRGITHALVLYEGEEHGFRKAENIADALESELSFFGQVLGFEPAGALATAEVKHL